MAAQARRRMHRAAWVLITSGGVAQVGYAVAESALPAPGQLFIEVGSVLTWETALFSGICCHIDVFPVKDFLAPRRLLSFCLLGC